MGNTARKQRKRDGIKFTKAPKVPTPPSERSYVTQPVPGPAGTHLQNAAQPRSKKSIERFLSRFTPTEEKK